MNYPFKYNVPYRWHLLLHTGIDSARFEVLADKIEQWLLNNVAAGDWEYWSPGGAMPMMTVYCRRVHNCILFSKEEDCLAFVLVFNMRIALWQHL